MMVPREQGRLWSWFEDVAKGEVRGWLAAACRWCLWPISCAYRWVVACRRHCYRTGVLPQQTVRVPVLSVGNITVGGTGKTPFVEWLASHLQSLGRRPAIVSRGYGAEGQEANDEHQLLAQNLPDVPHVLDPRRARGGASAVDKFEADCIILDDGFQHLALKRDLDLVLVDASMPFGNGRLLPAGVLREPVGQLARADVLVLTRVDAVSGERLDEVRATVGLAAPGVPLVECTHAPVALHELASDREEAPAWLSGRSVFWFCGIGSPSAFVGTLEHLGAHLVGGRPFPDHHRYEAGDLSARGDAAVEAGAEVIVTTQKDRVKLSMFDDWQLPAYWLRVAVRIARQEERLVQVISEALAERGEPGR